MNSLSLIFKKSLVDAAIAPYVFDSITKSPVRDADRQSSWLEIMGLSLAQPHMNCPNAEQLFSIITLKIVAYCGHAEFAGKNSFQELNLTRDKGELLASVFLKVGSESYLNGIASSLRAHKELSLWMSLGYKDDELANIGSLLRIPIEHLSLTFN
jgi:hypothetical protein